MKNKLEKEFKNMRKFQNLIDEKDFNLSLKKSMDLESSFKNKVILQAKLEKDKDGTVKQLKEELIGSEIINIGFPNCSIAGKNKYKRDNITLEGGLTFEYVKDNVKKRICIGYNELGSWIEC